MAQQPVLTRVVTEKVRISYAYVWAPQQSKVPKYNSKGELVPDKYSCKVLIPKTDKVTLKRLKDAIDVVKADPKSLAKWGGIIPPKMSMPLHDGDLNAATHAEDIGNWYISPKSQDMPQMIDARGQVIMDKNEIYSGAYCRVCFDVYAFGGAENKGIACGLRSIMKVEDGDPLAATHVDAAQDFASFVSGAEEIDPLADL